MAVRSRRRTSASRRKQTLGIRARPPTMFHHWRPGFGFTPPRSEIIREDSFFSKIPPFPTPCPPSHPPTIDFPCEAPMPFSVRPYRRFPICCPVTYHAGLHEGRGMVWNLSANGWRLSGDVPLRVGQTCPLTITVPTQQHIFCGCGDRSLGQGPRVWPGNLGD